MPSARALWTTGPGAAHVVTEALSPPRAHEVLVRTLYSALSRGTESLVFWGKVPESEYQRMRCPHQGGEFPFPVKYGYSSVGRVLDGPAELRDRLVFSLFPHQSAYVVPADSVLPLPDGVPPERAILGANLETAVNGAWDAGLLVGDRVTVVGAGVVGCLSAYLASRVPGIELELVDTDPARAAVARALGARFASPEQASPERDVVLHASGAPAGLRTALAICGVEGRIIELSWFGDAAVPLPLGGPFHAKRLSLRASQVGRLSPNARPRWTHRGRLALALELCRDPLLDRLIDGETSFDDLPAALPELLAKGRGGLCHRIGYA